MSPILTKTNANVVTGLLHSAPVAPSTDQIERTCGCLVILKGVAKGLSFNLIGCRARGVFKSELQLTELSKQRRRRRTRPVRVPSQRPAQTRFVPAPFTQICRRISLMFCLRSRFVERLNVRCWSGVAPSEELIALASTKPRLGHLSPGCRSWCDRNVKCDASQ